MTHTNRFSLTLENLAKLASDPDTLQTAPAPALPSLSAVLTEFSPLPRAALFLGLANDGLPILLNLLDPLPGPIMITGDKGCGKTNFLQTISSAINRIHSAEEVTYTVMSDKTAEWNNIQRTNNCTDILFVRGPSVVNNLRSIVEWAHSTKGDQQITLLLIDHLESLLVVPETQQDLRWLFLRGPSRHVWPIATINSSMAVSDLFRPWLNSFRTRLFGHIHDDAVTRILTGSSDDSFKHLTTGFQFAMREGKEWLPFWIPALD
jgi:hypothetical protein